MTHSCPTRRSSDLITAINRQFDERMLKADDGEDIQSEPYRIKNGAWILSRDWEKVGRYYQGKQRRLPPFEYSVTRTIDDPFAARDWLLQSRPLATDVYTACPPPGRTPGRPRACKTL